MAKEDLRFNIKLLPHGRADVELVNVGHRKDEKNTHEVIFKSSNQMISDAFGNAERVLRTKYGWR